MDNLQLERIPIAKTGMLVRKPVDEVFDAFIDPEITTKFWFTKGSGRLEDDISISVTAKVIEPNQRIVIEWPGYSGPTTVESIRCDAALDINRAPPQFWPASQSRTTAVLRSHMMAVVRRLRQRYAIMVETHGLTHVALAVHDLERSTRFYRNLLGAVVIYQDDATVQLQTPGNWDVIVLEHNPMEAGKAGGVLHFGFRLKRAKDIDAAVAAVEAAGGRVECTGEFVPGEPYVFAADPDGYEVELWYELPTPVDPPSGPNTG